MRTFLTLYKSAEVIFEKSHSNGDVIRSKLSEIRKLNIVFST